MEVGLVGREIFCRDFSQRVIPFEFFDDQLYGGSTIVKPPGIERSLGHIRYNNLIAVLAH